jgi:hypothetical protein
MPPPANDNALPGQWRRRLTLTVMVLSALAVVLKLSFG